MLSGCADLNLARFAPPGFVKYEDIASKKPPNPAIVERVAERAETPGEYPVLANTPAAGDRPEKLAAERRDAMAEFLVQRRDDVAAEVAADRAAAADERAVLAEIAEERKRRDEEISSELERAQQERAAPLQPAQ